MFRGKRVNFFLEKKNISFFLFPGSLFFTPSVSIPDTILIIPRWAMNANGDKEKNSPSQQKGKLQRGESFSFFWAKKKSFYCPFLGEWERVFLSNVFVVVKKKSLGSFYWLCFSFLRLRVKEALKFGAKGDNCSSTLPEMDYKKKSSTTKWNKKV